jgi:hypothetical protein
LSRSGSPENFSEDEEEEFDYFDQPIVNWTKNGKHLKKFKKHQDVGHWIENIVELSKDVKETFISNEISGDVLMTLTANDLKEMGITKLGIRKKLELALSRLYHDHCIQKIPNKNQVKEPSFIQPMDDFTSYDECVTSQSLNSMIPDDEMDEQHSLLEENENIFQCPTDGCGYIYAFDVQKNESHFRCDKCRKHYCFKCKCVYHHNMSCVQYSKWCWEHPKECERNKIKSFKKIPKIY